MTGTDTETWYAEGRATLGDRITAAREKAGLTPAEAARRLGVRLGTFEAWEADASEPRANRLQMLSGLLGVSLRWLMTGEGDGPDPDQAGLPQDARALLGELRGLAVEQARLADRIARSEKRLRQLLETAA
ncbi:MAG: helix-turn-helix domain-containing protein [Gemmobacter sp.]|uniref:helix-turn-helix domain-containing protein n=1 Tax=Gemmobacter sp. TaxID=1898957 RepID=UPI00391DA017